MINVWPCTLNPLKYELFHNFFLQVERMGPNELAFVQDIFYMKVLVSLLLRSIYGFFFGFTSTFH